MAHDLPPIITPRRGVPLSKPRPAGQFQGAASAASQSARAGWRGLDSQIRQPMESITLTAAHSHNQPRCIGGALLENKRPRHQRRTVGPWPTENQKSLRLKRKDDKALRHAWQRREHGTDGKVLEPRHDARRTRLASVVQGVIAVPARTTPGPHLNKPRPHRTRRTGDGDGVRQCADGVRDELVAR